jgi:hypothetical protein
LYKEKRTSICLVFKYTANFYLLIIYRRIISHSQTINEGIQTGLNVTKKEPLITILPPSCFSTLRSCERTYSTLSPPADPAAKPPLPVVVPAPRPRPGPSLWACELCARKRPQNYRAPKSTIIYIDIIDKNIILCKIFAKIYLEL